MLHTALSSFITKVRYEPIIMFVLFVLFVFVMNCFVLCGINSINNVLLWVWYDMWNDVMRCDVMQCCMWRRAMNPGL